MVFKNPYGYLIKYFKVIHLFLVCIYVYLAFKVSSILQYYNLYIQGNASKLDAMSYVTNYYFWAIIVSIVVCIVLYAVMRYKNKPRTLYLLLIALYLVVAVLVDMSYGGLNEISFSVLETKTLRLYRDLLRIIILFQYVSIILVLVRGLGFDVKKFNFVKDLEDLQLTEHDQEEIEVALGGTESIQRKIHRHLREFKYYVLENKAFILIIMVVVISILLGSVYVNVEFINKVYSEGEEFSTDEFRFNVLNTFVTNKDYNNTIISSGDSSYVVVRISLGTNRSIREFNTGNLILKSNNHSYSCNNKNSYNFVDLGTAYKNSKISNRATYLFIYYVDNKDIKNGMKLEYAGDKVVKLNPINLDKEQDVKKLSLGENIDWSNTVFSYGSFKISSFDIKDKFSYSYQYEAFGKTNTASLSIDGGKGRILNLVIEANIPFKDNLYDFMSSYATLKYKIGEQEYSSLFYDKTPGSYKDGLYLLVDEGVEKASSIWFDISVRSLKYQYVLK